MSNDECSGVGVQRAMGHPPFYTSLTFAPAPPTQITQQAWDYQVQPVNNINTEPAQVCILLC